MNLRPRTTPFRGKRGLIAALFAFIAGGGSTDSEAYLNTKRAGFRSGKHNGRQPGAFGGSKTAKAHRRPYFNA